MYGEVLRVEASCLRTLHRDIETPPGPVLPMAQQ